jgi:hypothetical protein
MFLVKSVSVTSVCIVVLHLVISSTPEKIAHLNVENELYKSVLTPQEHTTYVDNVVSD